MAHQSCKTCKGKGHTKATRPTVESVGKKFTTKELGSGCPDCLGLGIKGERREISIGTDGSVTERVR